MKFSSVIVFVIVTILGVVVCGCADEEIYATSIHNESGDNFFQGNCTGGIKVVNSDGTTVCRDITTWYWQLVPNETSFNGSGDLNVFLDFKETDNLSYYYIIGDDVYG